MPDLATRAPRSIDSRADHQELTQLARRAKTDGGARDDLFNHPGFDSLLNLVSRILFMRFGAIGDFLDPDDVKEMLQYKLFYGLDQFEGRGSLKSYLIGIGTNAYLDERRRVQCAERYLAGQSFIEADLQTPRNIHRRVELEHAAAKLSPYDRLLYELLKMCKSKQDIAKEVNKSVPQVYRDLQKLIYQLSEVAGIQSESGSNS